MNILLIIVAVLILGAILWRLGSKRYVLPCPSWLSWMVELDNPFAKENQSASIIGHLNVHKGMCVVDIGCGPGRVTIPLSRKVGSNGAVVAIDLQQEMLDKVRAKASNLSNIEFRQGALGDQILEKGKYDYILLVNVLGEIPKQRAALEEVSHALKSSGILSVTETIFDPHFQRIRKLTGLAKSVGFLEPEVFGKQYSYTAHFRVSKG